MIFIIIRKILATEFYNLDINQIPPNFPYSIGIHPKDIEMDNIEMQFTWIRSMMFKNCFAIGECGLDSFVEVDQKIQEEVF